MKKLAIFLGVYAVIVFSLFFFMDISISNSYQRAVSAAYIADFLKDELWHVNSFSDVFNHFVDGQHHYRIFSGIADWPPLQLIILTISFFVFGMNKFAFIIPNLIITILTLYFLHRLVFTIYKNEKIAFLSVIFASLLPLFFQQAGSPMLENGLLLFTILALLYSFEYSQTHKSKHLYLAAAAFGFGFLYKTQMIFIIPAMLYLIYPALNKLNPKKITKIGLISVGILLLTLSPLILREAVLMPNGISTFTERSVGRVEVLSNENMELPGFAYAYDFEFENDLPQYKKDIIIHRYNLSYAQKSVLSLSSLFFPLFILPFVLFGTFYSRKNHHRLEIAIFIFTISTLAILTVHGLIPRYLIPASAFLMLFAARGISLLPKKVVITSSVIFVILLLAFLSHFFVRVYHNEHIQSMQHDYESTAQYLLKTSLEPFTVVTSRPYQMAYYLFKNDYAKKAYVEFLPEKREEFEQLLLGNAVSENVPEQFSHLNPPIRFAVVHEHLEKGPLTGIADYDANTFLSEKSVLDTVIGSRFPNSKTWIYRFE